MEILTSDLSLRPALARTQAVGGRVARNRLVMGPLCTMYAAPDGSVTPQLIEYYRARARGGAALIIVELTYIDDIASKSFHAQLGAHSDMMVPGLSDLAEAIKGEGALAGLQIAHCGSQRVAGAGRVLAPSPIAWAEGKPVPDEMTEDDIAQVLDAFADAAGRLAGAGFDLVELQAAHGYLANTFICPATNTRTDDYGGTHENRMRFPLELVSRVRARIGPDRLMSVRMNGHDLMPGGYETTDYCRVAQDFATAGVDILHVSAGTYRAMERRVTPMYLDEAPFVGFAAEIKHAVNIPIIAAGTIHSLDTAEALVAKGGADFVAMARPIFADPDLPRKVLTGREVEIIPCIRCNTCVAREQAGARSLCAINPVTGHEGDPLKPAATPQRVVIAGGGPAGLQAGLTAALRGHTVTLIERCASLGGALAIAAQLPFKRSLARYLESLSHAAENAGVEILLGQDIADHTELAMAADHLIVAHGAHWPKPDFPGISVIDPLTAITAPDTVGNSVLVIGASLAGAETAWHLATKGHEVTLTDPRGDFAEDVNLVARLILPEQLATTGVATRFNCQVSSAGVGTLHLDSDGATDDLQPDTIITAGMMKPVSAAWAAPIAQTATRIHLIGEAAGLYGLRWATHTAATTAREF